jgi:hypothetical protein
MGMLSGAVRPLSTSRSVADNNMEFRLADQARPNRGMLSGVIVSLAAGVMVTRNGVNESVDSFGSRSGIC